MLGAGHVFAELSTAELEQAVHDPVRCGVAERFSASAADGLDSRFRGNDQRFEGNPIPNDTITRGHNSIDAGTTAVLST